MRLEYQNKLEVEVCCEGTISVLAGTRRWNTRGDFEPYIEVYEEETGRNRTYSWLTCNQVTQEEYKTGYSRGIRTIYEGFPFCENFSFGTYVEIYEPTGQVKVGIIPLNDHYYALRRLVWPGPMEFHEICQNHYTVYPLQQGILIPNGWEREIRLQDRWELDAEQPYSRSAYMPWFGQVRGKEGYWCLVNTPFDAGFSLEHRAGGDCSVGTIWYSQLGQLGYKRESTYTFYEECDYNLFCKQFREYLKETGELCTLREKIIKNPAVESLIGSAVFHDGIYSRIEPESFYYNKEHPKKNERLVTFAEMEKRIEATKALGIEKAFVHIDGWARMGYDNQHPDALPPCEKAGGWRGFKSLCATVKNLGYQFAIHDQYRDYFLAAPSYKPEYSKKNMDGSADGCSIWYGGRQEYLCPEFYLGFVKRNFMGLKENGIQLDGAYLDVFSCIPLEECYAPLHRVTREQCMKERKKCFDYVRAQGIIISSEEGTCWAMRDLDLIHHAPYVREAREDPTQICGEILPESIGMPVPLLNLVYHDCVVTPWYIDHSGSEMPNNQSGFLHALLNGGIAYVHSTFTAEEINQVKTVACWHEKVGTSEMIRHEFLSPDGNIQRVCFANGSEITVDFEHNTYEMIN